MRGGDASIFVSEVKLGCDMRDQIADLLKWILVPVVVVGAMALLRKLFPMKQAETMVREPSIDSLDNRNREEPSFEELDDRFRKMVWPFNLSMIAIGLVFAWGTHALLVWINHALAVADPSAVFRELPDRTMAVAARRVSMTGRGRSAESSPQWRANFSRPARSS